MLYKVDLSRVEKVLRYKIPYEIVEKVHIWVLRVEIDGMNKTRLIKSYHDEPLKGGESWRKVYPSEQKISTHLSRTA